MKCQCHKCNSVFEVSGNYAFMVLTGGLDCPECKEKDAIDIVVAEQKR